MADGLSIDFSDILKLAADLGDVPKTAGRNIRKAVEVTARHVKDDWREPLQGSALLPRGPYSISYDIKGTGRSVEAEIGPELKGQGALIGMLEYGTPSTGPTGYGAKALQQNQDDFEKGLLKAIGDVL